MSREDSQGWGWLFLFLLSARAPVSPTRVMYTCWVACAVFVCCVCKVTFCLDIYAHIFVFLRFVVLKVRFLYPATNTSLECMLSPVRVPGGNCWCAFQECGLLVVQLTCLRFLFVFMHPCLVDLLDDSVWTSFGNFIQDSGNLFYFSLGPLKAAMNLVVVLAVALLLNQLGESVTVFILVVTISPLAQWWTCACKIRVAH